MVPRTVRVSRRHDAAIAALLLLAAAGLHPAQSARAQGTPKPWTPPAHATSPAPLQAQTVKPFAASDTLVRMANSAKLRFQRQRGDSVGGDNFDGYQIVGDMGRKVLVQLGRNHWLQAQAVEATLDSLGLDVEVRTDPQMKAAVFMLVRNPYLRSSDAVGFIYWQRANELRMQGASYPPCQDFSVRFWYTGQTTAPYESITLFRLRDKASRLAMRLYRLNDAGVYWELVQYEGHGPDLGISTEANFADINSDGQPELVAYHQVTPDSFLVLQGGTPPIIEEYTYTERPEGFVLHDVRLLPGPAETVHMFSTLLVQKQPELARRLMLQPAKLDSVMALGWGSHRGRGDWNIEYGEAQPWPEWLELKIRQDSGVKHWIFHFWIKDGRWVIRDWIPVQPPENHTVAAPVRIPDAPGKGKKP